MRFAWPAVAPATIVLLLLLCAAGGIRLASLDSSTILGERQYRSALIARHYYYNALDTVEPWKLRIARLNRNREGMLEPPILERVVSWLYLVAGGESLRIPRVLSVVFWLFGGVFLYRLALRFMSPAGALVGTAYYLFNPVGVNVSTGFLPDPLMMALFVLSLLALMRFLETPNRVRLGQAALVMALAVLVKPLCLFAILGAVLAVAIHERGRAFLDSATLVLLGAILIPTVAYYVYGMFLRPALAPTSDDVVAWDSLARSASVSFVPHLVLGREFWIGWYRTALHVVGVLPLLAGLVGVALLQHGRGLALVSGLVTGYVVFGLAFTYLTPFAAHYHLQLTIVVAIALGVIADVVVRQLRSTIRRRYLWVLPAGATLLIAVLTSRAIARETRPQPRESVRLAEMIGDLVGHSERVVNVATYYAKPLQYYGEYYGTWWPPAIEGYEFGELRQEPRTLEARLEALGFDPEYFVITDLRGYDLRHQDLRNYLETDCKLVAAAANEYLIYGHCQKPSTSVQVVE